MSHNQIVKEQLIHMLVCTVIFVVLGSFAVGLDLAAAYVATLGVSTFTHQALTLTAHALLILDLTLFLVYLGTSSIELVKEMIK